MNQSELIEKKRRFIKRTYFGVSDNPLDDVNPFDAWDEFLAAKVKDMNWGINPDAIKRSKIRFAYNFNKILDHYSVLLGLDDILVDLDNDAQTNESMINTWADKAIFPGDKTETENKVEEK
ncbi:hypothetical protein ASE74_00275 [Pedobacter sp. Leaf216]|uniref:hypothetical protein n=1 Tax=Pedobacter sp. Leaf216 TaxID=1735684 RepID=UPI0006F79DD9|nr:hypothetical protein [Pedobacter sp. Leaf216]KQM79054.1 hypothetical protein ASE74_00275 [Pedobacter sp. Leaf216]